MEKEEGLLFDKGKRLKMCFPSKTQQTNKAAA